MHIYRDKENTFLLSALDPQSQLSKDTKNSEDYKATLEMDKVMCVDKKITNSNNYVIIRMKVLKNLEESISEMIKYIGENKTIRIPDKTIDRYGLVKILVIKK